MRTPAILLALLAGAACASTATPPPASDRVLAVDSDGTVIHQSTSDENARALFAAPATRVWPALVAAYTELGIQPTVSDRATGQYGNMGFVAPRRIFGKGLGQYFRCGSSMTGPLVETGRVYANVVSNLTDDGKGGTIVMTHVSATLRRNEGTSGDPINCGSTGAIEEHIRTSVARHLAGS